MKFNWTCHGIYELELEHNNFKARVRDWYKNRSELVTELQGWRRWEYTILLRNGDVLGTGLTDTRQEAQSEAERIIKLLIVGNLLVEMQTLGLT